MTELDDIRARDTSTGIPNGPHDTQAERDRRSLLRQLDMAATVIAEVRNHWAYLGQKHTHLYALIDLALKEIEK